MAPESAARAPDPAARRAAPRATRRRALGTIAALLLLTPLCWWLIQAHVVGRVLQFDITTHNAGPRWALQWTRATDGRENGVWLDLPGLAAGRGAETLTIRFSGQAGDPERGFEFWLYDVRPLDAHAAPPDLKAAVASGTTEDVVGPWQPFDVGPGVVIQTREPGFLRLGAPPGGVAVATARTPNGGVVEFSYGDDLRTFDLCGPEIAAEQVVLRRRGVPPGEQLCVREAIPNYTIGQVRLRWLDSPGAEVHLSGARVEISVFGLLVKSRPVRVQTDHRDATFTRADAGYNPTFVTNSADGQVAWNIGEGFSRTVHAVGLGCVFAGLLAILAAVSLACHVARGRLRAVCSPFWLALTAVVAVRLWLATWATFLISTDGGGYTWHAAVLLKTGAIDHIRRMWLPGYVVFLSPFIAFFEDFGPIVAAVQQLLGVGSAVLVYGTARCLLPPGWSAAAMLLFGLDPVQLTYERWIMTEALATFLLTLACYLAARSQSHGSAANWRSAAAWGLAIGLVCGLAPYVRANLQTLFVLLPLMLLLCSLRRRTVAPALLQASIVAAVAVACIWPWCALNYARYGRFGLSITQNYSLLLNLWNHDALDVNQTAALDASELSRLREDVAGGQFGPPRLFAMIRDSAASSAPPHERPWIRGERRAREVIDESAARRPLATFPARAMALMVQLGLWTKFDGQKPNETEWAAAAFRGRPLGPTNVLFEPAAIEADVAPDPYPDLIRRMQRSTASLAGSWPARWFDEYFGAWRLFRPLIGVLVLIGLAVAVMRREWMVVGFGVIVIANAIALAWLVVSAIDRYNVPFAGLSAVVSMYAALVLLVQRKQSGTAAAGLVPELPERQL